MDNKRRIELLRARIELTKTVNFDDVTARQLWQRDSQTVLNYVFGKDSRHAKDFADVRWTPGVVSMSAEVNRQYENEAVGKGLRASRIILESCVNELTEFGDEIAQETPTPSSLIERICERFHSVARQLRLRRTGRPVLDIDDEYDVQYLVHALLVLDFEDIRPEEWTPSYAGGASRMDFLLKNEEIVLEVKRTRSGLDAKALGEQLIVDCQKYKTHPHCKTLFCFAYDPEGRIANPRGIERDLASAGGDLQVKVFIRP